MASGPTIAGIGEALFDIFPDRQLLGGAPLNVAFHAHQLGGQGVVVSRVGQDTLGDEVVRTLRERGMTDGFVQRDPDRPTGIVYITPTPGSAPAPGSADAGMVELGGDEADQEGGEADEAEGHEFEIVSNVAWDWIQFDPDLESLAGRCDAVVFGTLAQREAESRGAIGRFLSLARRAVRLFDVNLRQNFYDARLIRRSCELATVLKLNRRELRTLADLLGWSGEDDDALCRDAIKRTEVRMLALTRGSAGTVLFDAAGNRAESEVPKPEAAEGADHVGAGDACSAGLLIGLLRRWPLERTVRLANQMGAWVASQPGATPLLSPEQRDAWLAN